MYTIKVEGLDELIARLQAANAEVAAKAVASALYQQAQGTITAAKQSCPVDTGNLRASGHVLLPEMSGSSATVTLGFGGPAGAGNVDGETNNDNVGYALYVHENLEAHHPVGSPKYLEGPLLARVNNEILEGLKESVQENYLRLLKK